MLKCPTCEGLHTTSAARCEVCGTLLYPEPVSISYVLEIAKGHYQRPLPWGTWEWVAGASGPDGLASLRKDAPHFTERYHTRIRCVTRVWGNDGEILSETNTILPLEA